MFCSLVFLAIIGLIIIVSVKILTVSKPYEDNLEYFKNIGSKSYFIK